MNKSFLKKESPLGRQGLTPCDYLKTVYVAKQNGEDGFIVELTSVGPQQHLHDNPLAVWHLLDASQAPAPNSPSRLRQMPSSLCPREREIQKERLCSLTPSTPLPQGKACPSSVGCVLGAAPPPQSLPPQLFSAVSPVVLSSSLSAALFLSCEHPLCHPGEGRSSLSLQRGWKINTSDLSNM